MRISLRDLSDRDLVRKALVVVAVVAAWLVASAILPAHLPLGVALEGIVLGGLNGLVAIGLVLLYRSVRIINFAQAAIGGLAASAAIIMVGGWGVSYYLAVPAGILVGVLTGWLIDLVVARRFANAPRLIFTVATLGLAQILGAAEVGLPHIVSHMSNVSSTFSTPFHFSFTFSGIVFSGNDLVALIVVPIALLGIWWFLSKTDTGIAIKAVADSRDRATLLGIPVRRLSMVTWMVAAGLSGVGAILSAPILGPNVGVASGPTVLLAPLAAAVLASMESLPAAMAWSLGIGVFGQAVFWSYHNSVAENVGLFVLILIGLFLQHRQQTRVDDEGLGGYVAVREVKPIPDWLARRPGIVVARKALIGGMVLLAVLVPLALSTPRVTLLAYMAIFGIIAVSLVVLSGWAGQLSLGQFAFVGAGSAAVGSLLVHAHVELFVALFIAALVGGVVAIVIGVPALRLPGLYLAVTTLAFAVAMSTWVLSSSYFPLLNPSTVPRPVLFDRFNLSSSLSFYYLCLLVLVFALYLARNLRRSRAGRVILAVRDNARAASAYSVSPLKAKLIAFAFSGALAGVAGGLYVLGLGGIGYAGFPPQESLTVLTMAVIGGLGSLPGAILGAVYVEGVLYFLRGGLQLLASGAGLLVLLMVVPEGLGGLMFDLRDRLLSLIARRIEAREVVRLDELDDTVQPDSSLPDNSKHSPGEPLVYTAALRLEALEDLEEADFSSASNSPSMGRSAASTAGRSSMAWPQDGSPAILGIQDLSGGYGKLRVLHDISLGVAQGEVLALLGTNGAGKSTLIRTIAGLRSPWKGAISFIGNDLATRNAVERVRSGIATMLGGQGIFPSLTVRENLRMAGWTARRYHHDLRFVELATDRVLSMFPVLADRIDTRAGLLSGGEQQMLALSQALLCKPKVLLIDELSLGLAPTIISQLLQVIRTLAISGVTVIVVEQSINVATAIASRAVFIERGRIRFSGATPDLSQQPELVRSVFLRAAAKAGSRPISEWTTRQHVPSPLRVGVENLSPPAYQGAENLPPPPPAQPSIEDLVAQALGGESYRDGVGSPSVSSPSEVGEKGDDHEPFRVMQLRDDRADPQNGQRFDKPTVPAFMVQNVTKQFGGVAALRGVTLSVDQGEILGVIGANGAGKTTFFDVCSGFVLPDTGRIMMAGRDITNLYAAQRALLGLGRVFQEARLFPTLTVSEAISLALERRVEVKDPLASMLGLSAVRRSEAKVAEMVEELLDRMGIRRWRDSFVSELSTGTRRVVELACAVAHEPSVLLLDEPSAGIAQRESEALGELLLGLREETGAAFIIIEHDVPLVSSLADRLVCMHLGEVIAEGEPTLVLNAPAVIAAYLGTDEAVIGRSGGARSNHEGSGDSREEKAHTHGATEGKREKNDEYSNLSRQGSQAENE